jgi:hypothetical protein
MDQVVTDDLETGPTSCVVARRRSTFFEDYHMASRIVFELDDDGSIVSVSHESNSDTAHHEPVATTDEATLARQLLDRCKVIEIETLLRSYPCSRLIRVAAYGLHRWKRGELKSANPSGLVLTILRRKSEVPDFVDTVLEHLKPQKQTTIDVDRENAQRQNFAELLDEYRRRNTR